MDAVPAIPRRVVIGHDERGVSVFAADGRCPSSGPRRTARMAFILVDGCFTVELLDSLGGDVLGGLLHDPMKGEA